MSPQYNYINTLGINSRDISHGFTGNANSQGAGKPECSDNLKSAQRPAVLLSTTYTKAIIILCPQSGGLRIMGQATQANTGA
jgi:hypothetical protein